MNIAPAPQELHNILQRQKAAHLSPKANSKLPFPAPSSGNRNNSLTSLAGSFRRKGLDGQAIETVLLTYNAQLAEPLSDQEVVGIAASVCRYDPALELTEQKLSVGFATKFGGRLRFSLSHGWWFHDGKVWVRDPRGLYAQECAKQLVTEIREWIAASDSFSSDEKEKMTKRVFSLQRKSPINNIADLAKSDQLVLDSGSWEEPAMTLNFQNGTIKLPSLQLRPHDPADRLTRILNYEYDPKATSPNFDKVVADALGGEVADLLLQLLGYSLKGTGELQNFVMMIGAGRNGKTTIVEAVSHAMGIYATTAEPSTFMKSANKSSINNDIASLAGARLVATSELNTGQVLDAALAKRMSGGDVVKARFLNQEYFEFRPKALNVLVANFPPVFDGSDFGLSRRFIMINFAAVLANEDVDPTLPKKLREEAPGIMNRLLEGYVKYEKDGLVIPPSVQAATDALVRSGNQTQQFFDACCEMKSDARGGARELYQAYQTWVLSEIGAKPMSMPAFRAAAERTAGTPPIRTNRGWVWPGIALRKPGI